MPLARSKITAQGQISVPAEVRKKLGVGPGSILEWEEEGNKIVVHRGGKYSFEEIHQKIFKGRKPKPHTIEEMDEGIAQYMRDKYGRH